MLNLLQDYYKVRYYTGTFRIYGTVLYLMHDEMVRYCNCTVPYRYGTRSYYMGELLQNEDTTYILSKYFIIFILLYEFGYIARIGQRHIDEIR